MPGAIGIALILLVFPALVWVGVALVAFVAGALLPSYAVETHEGSELIETNV